MLQNILESPLYTTCLVFLSLATVACEDKGQRASPAGGPAAAGGTTGAGGQAAAALKGKGGYTVAEVAAPGSLEVTAIFKGDPIPEQTEVPVNTNVDVCGHKVFTENVIVDKEMRGLANVVVRLEGISAGKKPPEVITINNKNCSFQPHVGVAVKGMKLAITSDDPILHTTHLRMGGRSLYNLQVRANQDPPTPRPIPRTGLMEVKCDVHKWMQAFIVVHASPYIGVTDAQGKLVIGEIPPGTYPYVAWHEELGEQKGEVTIAAGQAAALRVELEPADE